MQHTPEPWYQCGGFTPKFGGIAAKASMIVDSFADCYEVNAPDYDTQFENRKRIVACVNACAGYDTVALEAAGLGYFHKTIPELIADIKGKQEVLLGAIELIELVVANTKRIKELAESEAIREAADTIISLLKN